ncbi:hypothetical protein L6164_026282 [Bauhinia variegata]|uniref:Uncharacterized protein n=1 Tax=Bauhinia variegata TaxID=167791 RepID=A0ACB9LPM4_BAUVA|nr:hypothetical protein L6164_026282 [Bauhinia variegata]
MGFYSQLVSHFALLIIPILTRFLSFHVEPFTPNITTDKEALISFKSQLSNDPPHPLYSWDHNSSPCNWTGVFCNNLHDNRVVALNLSGLGLSGHISTYIGNLSFHDSLQLQNNQLTGVIPDQIDIDLLIKLEVKLGKNNLYGTIPPSLGNISTLTNISFGTNTLSGKIPSHLGRLKNLIELDLTINNLTGTIPPSIYNLSSLVNFALAANDLWGEFPEDVGNRLPKLLVFRVEFLDPCTISPTLKLSKWLTTRLMELYHQV